MSSTRMAMGGLGAALAAAALAGAAGPAFAQSMSLREHLFGGAAPDERAFATPNVARFQPDFGEPFVIDRSAGRQLFMKFEDSPEIWALNPTSGPGGDIIYKNDVGEPVLRTTRLGGLTLFTSDRPEGVAAAFAGQAPLLHGPVVLNPGQLVQVFAQASERAARAARRPISFETENVPLTAASMMADAAQLAAEAFVDVASQSEANRRLLLRYAKVEFGLGHNPEASTKGEVVKITVAPNRGLAGRPSSHRIAAALAKR